MPSDYFTCTEDNTKTEALQAFRSELDRQVNKVKEAGERFKLSSAVFTEAHVFPLRKDFDKVIAESSAGLSASNILLVSGQYQTTTPSEDVLSAIGLPTSSDKEDLEKLLSSRHNLHVVEGQLLIPGELEITSAKHLYERLDYNISEFTRLVSGGHGLPFILVSLHKTQTDADLGTDCSPGKAPEETTKVLGINKNLKKVATDNNVPFDEISIEVYWLNEILGSPPNIRQLRGLGLIPFQLGASLTEGTVDSTTTYVIEDTDDILGMFGFTDTTLDNVLQREKLTSIDINPETESLVREAKSRLGSSLLDKDENGISSLQPSGLLLAQTLDLSTFLDVQRLDQPVDIISEDIYTDEVLESLEYAVQAVQEAFEALNAALVAFQESINALLGPILSSLTLVENLLNQYVSGGTPLLQCLFGAMSVNISLSADFFEDIFDDIADLLDPLLEVMDLTRDIFLSLSAPSCLVQSLMDALLDNSPDNPGLECLSLMVRYGFDIPTEIEDVSTDLWTNESLPEPGNTFKNLAMVSDLMQAMVSEVQNTIRDLVSWVQNIALNLDLDAENRSESCNSETITEILSQLNIEASA